MRVNRLIPLLAIVILAAACSSGSSAPSGTAAEIAGKVFATAGVEPFGETIALQSPDQIEYFLGSTNYPAFTDTAVVQPLINLDTRIMYVLVVGSSEEADAVVKQLDKDVDPTKLVCVQFSRDDVVVHTRDNVVFMVIDADHTERDALADAFTSID